MLLEYSPCRFEVNISPHKSPISYFYMTIFYILFLNYFCFPLLVHQLISIRTQKNPPFLILVATI